MRPGDPESLRVAGAGAAQGPGHLRQEHAGRHVAWTRGGKVPHGVVHDQMDHVLQQTGDVVPLLKLRKARGRTRTATS